MTTEQALDVLEQERKSIDDYNERYVADALEHAYKHTLTRKQRDQVGRIYPTRVEYVHRHFRRIKDNYPRYMTERNVLDALSEILSI